MLRSKSCSVHFQLQANQNNFVFKIVRSDDSEPVVVSENVRELNIDRLDQGGPMELISSLKRTRSGRLVKPPLDTWRGQYLDVKGDCISVCPGSEKDPVSLLRDHGTLRFFT